MENLFLKASLMSFASVALCTVGMLPGWGEPVKGNPNEAAEGTNTFAFNLYEQVRSREGNLFFSPLNLRNALSMVATGARGATAVEMEKTLVLHDLQRAIADVAALELLMLPTATKPAYELRIANALWVQDGFPLNPDFSQRLRTEFRVRADSVDFRGDPEQARVRINGWVSEHTQGKIPMLFGPGSIHEELRLALTTALYFKAGWREPFDKKLTKDEPFFLSTGGERNVPMMRLTEDLRYGEDAACQWVSLPYRDCPLEMVLFVPKAKKGLADLEKSLSARNLQERKAASSTAQVTLHLPRFKMSTGLDLRTTLEAMGMPLAFSRHADFTGICSSERLMIDKVIHKAFVEVNEVGTEAAAATGITMMPTAMPMPKKQVTVRADRPFVFCIRDQRTDTLLFLGRYVEPTQE